MELVVKRITNLLKIKSLITLTLTAVFAYKAVIGHITPDQFMTIFTMIIGFYFGTQADRKAESEATVAKKETAAEETADAHA